MGNGSDEPGLPPEEQFSLSEFPRNFSDKDFESKFLKLLEKLQNQEENRSQLEAGTQLSHATEVTQVPHRSSLLAPNRGESPIKASHISYIQSLNSNQFEYANQLRTYDKYKTKNMQQANLANKINDAIRLIRVQDQNMRIIQPTPTGSNQRSKQTVEGQRSGLVNMAFGTEDGSKVRLEGALLNQEESIRSFENESRNYFIMVPSDTEGSAFFYNSMSPQPTSQLQHDMHSRIQIQVHENQHNHQSIKNYLQIINKFQDPQKASMQALQQPPAFSQQQFMFQQAISPKVSISHENSNEHSNQHIPVYEQAQNINLEQIFIQPPTGFQKMPSQGETSDAHSKPLIVMQGVQSEQRMPAVKMDSGTQIQLPTIMSNSRTGVELHQVKISRLHQVPSNNNQQSEDIDTQHHELDNARSTQENIHEVHGTSQN